MAELARGNVDDRPWGLTFAALGRRGLSGQLTLTSEGKQYRVAFGAGAVVAATSPIANDAAVRIALTANLISSSQVNDIARRLAAAPGDDEIEVVAEHARLQPDMVQRLRRRVVAQRAARTFAIERGEFVVEDAVTIPVLPGNELDVRAIVYLGAKTNMAESRLVGELARLGAWFKLKPEMMPELAQFGFGDAEKPALKRVIEGANLGDFAGDPELDARTARTVLYALVACNACEISAERRGPARTPPAPATGRATKPPTIPPAAAAEIVRERQRRNSAQVSVARSTGAFSVPMRTEASGAFAMPTKTEASGSFPMPTRPPTGERSGAFVLPRNEGSVSTKMPTPPAGLDGPAMTRTRTQTGAPPVSGPARAKASTGAAIETQKLIAELVPLLDKNADHFTMLGVTANATPDAVRSAYFNLARKLHPDRLSALGIADPQRNAQRLFAHLNAVFATLSDPAKRAEYVALQKRGGEAAARAEDQRAEELALRIVRAEEAFRQGEMALRREQLPQAIAAFTQAVELQPDETDYQALLAWSKFAAAPDKQAIASATRTTLQRAAERSQSVTPMFYLGRVERILGREREALARFHEVLEIMPGHSEAAAEVRVLEQRLRSGKR